MKAMIWRAVMVVMMVAGASWVRGAEGAGAAPEGSGAVRFVAVDVEVDAGKVGLGAYQVELDAGDGVLVGVEGGESAAFREAPFYDPKALERHRIVLAAFHVAGAGGAGGELPTGETRVARVHLEMLGGRGMAEVQSKLVVATDGAGRAIDATVRVKPFEGAK
ncbi:MAG TPA: hypothetical protein VHQ47_14660 [Phycisphaerae bacterium]|nr:hypothetical protein [Phycisphaerae bacterium]